MAQKGAKLFAFFDAEIKSISTHNWSRHEKFLSQQCEISTSSTKNSQLAHRWFTSLHLVSLLCLYPTNAHWCNTCVMFCFARVKINTLQVYPKLFSINFQFNIRYYTILNFTVMLINLRNKRKIEKKYTKKMPHTVWSAKNRTRRVETKDWRKLWAVKQKTTKLKLRYPTQHIYLSVRATFTAVRELKM